VTRLLLALFLPLSLLIGAAPWLGAVEIPSRPPARVTDLTGTISPEERDRLEAKLAAFERETTHQVAVLIIPSLEGEDIESLGHRIAAGWKLGQVGKDNGVLLLIAKGDQRLRIEVGYGLEGVLPDGKTGAIIREVIAPRFRRGEFAQGIEAGVEAIIAETRGAAIPEAGQRPGKTAAARASAIPLLVAAAALATVFAYPLLRRLPNMLFWTGAGFGAAALVGFLLVYPGAWWTSLFGLVGLALGTLWSVGIAERHRCPAGRHWLDVRRRRARDVELVSYDCPVCGYRRVDRVALAAAGTAGWFIGSGWTSGGGWGSGGGTGGFSGGGGDFGGGGASGSW